MTAETERTKNNDLPGDTFPEAAFLFSKNVVIHHREFVAGEPYRYAAGLSEKSWYVCSINGWLTR